MHLLSWHGTVMCLPDAAGAITHCPLPFNLDAPLPMAFDAERLAERGLLQHPEMGLLRIETAAAPGGLHLSRDGMYVCAESYSPVVKFDRSTADGWETWLPISGEDLADLQHILRHRWIIRETRRVLPRNLIGFADGFVLRLGHLEIDLAGTLGTAVDARGGAGRPERLIVMDGDAEIELVIAEPRSSPLLDTALWPVRGRRIAEIVTLAAHRHVTKLEPTQEVFERDAAGVQANRGAAGLSDLLEQLAAAADAKKPDAAQELAEATAPDMQQPIPAADARRDDVLMAWALREMAPWLLKQVQPSRADFVFDELNTTEDWAFVYSFVDGDVTMWPKPQAAMPDEAGQQRAKCYLRLFKAAARLLPAEYRATLCLGIADAVGADYGVPLFCFQKTARANTILLPDIDFLLSDFHRDSNYVDRLSYADKTPTAVFAGSTTGGTITPEVARNHALPRLRAANFFAGSSVVDFRLPGITQCSSAEAESLLMSNRFCRLPKLTWQQQLRHRFVISMDGNGATCSRVAIALHSNSVLLKYNSDNMLFYFGGLQPWLHYVPIAADRNVERIIALETLMPDAFERIAENGRGFAQTYLSEAAIHRYTAMLLQLYAQCFAGEEQKIATLAVPPSRNSSSAASATLLVGHIQNHGDETSRIDDWLGFVGKAVALEGFTIILGEGMPADGFSYQAVRADGTLSEPSQNEEYCGTRGENLPIYGFCINAAGAFADEYEITYEASFVDGCKAGPLTAGTVCKSETNAPLGAIRLCIVQRADTAPQAAHAETQA